MKIKSLSHVGITVSNFEKAVRWYWEMFKFPLVAEETMDVHQVEALYSLYGLKNTKLRLGFLRIPGGGVLEIFEFKPAIPADKVCWNKIGFTHITLDVGNVKKWYKKLKEKGVTFLCEPQKTGSNEWVFMKDMDGNLIELIDLKFNYIALHYLGAIVAPLLRRLQFGKYYK
ncbi:MAG: VOC family protein [Spirochaetes bacterium]|jgi:catechol 2,3-dioxygenase-like lactoylglutathione lyase family enzyme|nr:VOC family protein [Spirochaetota bacterium]MBP8987862.1 VOC family protein [Spirochaetota bacterium]